MSEESSNIAEVTYAGGISATFDSQLEELAKKHHGECEGGGTWLLGERSRDLSFLFSTLEDAKAFADEAAEFGWVQSSMVQSYSWNEDGYVKDDPA